MTARPAPAGRAGRIKWQQVQKGSISWQRVQARPAIIVARARIPWRFSDQDRTWLLRVDRGTARQWRDAAKSLVRRDKDGDVAQAVEIQSYGQLQCVQRPQALIHSVLNQ